MSQLCEGQAFQNGCRHCCADPNFQSPPMWVKAQALLILEINELQFVQNLRIQPFSMFSSDVLSRQLVIRGLIYDQNRKKRGLLNMPERMLLSISR